MKVEVTQSGPTLCNPMDYTVQVILQARILEWVAFPFSRGSSQPRDQTQVSRIVGGFFTEYEVSHKGSPKNMVLKPLYLKLQEGYRNQWGRASEGPLETHQRGYPGVPILVNLLKRGVLPLN